ncbi:Alkylglycerol monooxygenase-like 4 [Homarus americanus]|uniref:Alkylglycerol monooxygenase n=1 Tax=Homarus americanus TaxID=6706 RepID=A0A8J5JYD2_HOMAM|nr:Alkylglycerol monooxygenase-like 4 [Homarus americanus]
MLKGKPVGRLNDSLTSMGHGLIYEISKLVMRGLELYGYKWLYERRVVDLDWSSPITWWVAAIGVNFIWAAHQVHHSSEDYNITTAFRQSIFQRFFAIGFYHPLALLGVPLPAILVHIQFNLLFQFWIHTELVENCGPLEWIINTPSHHRVHHGVFIVWDRMFGTFQQEKKDEKIVYGLVEQPQSFNVIWLQFYYMVAVLRKAKSMTTWGDTLRALFYGPGWFPGTPRLGDPDTFPDVKASRTKYDRYLPLWEQVYVAVHFAVALIVQQVLTIHLMTFSWVTVLGYIIFIVVTTGIIGATYDGWWWAPLMEAIRCAAYVAYARTRPVTGYPQIDAALVAYFAVSTLVWASRSLTVLNVATKTAKLE